MLNDLNRVDFGNVQEQASWVCQCDANMVQKLEGEFKATLQEQVLLSFISSYPHFIIVKRQTPAFSISYVISQLLVLKMPKTEV